MGIKRWLSALVLVCGLATSAQAQSQVVYDGFENLTGPWTANGCAKVTTAKDGGLPKLGSWMLQCNMSFEEVYLQTIPYGSSFLVRYWVRYDQDVDYKVGSKQGRIGAFTSEELLFACQLEQGASATLFVGLNNRSTFWGSPLGVCGHKRWFKVELARQDNGPIKLWIDDVLQPTPSDWRSVGHIRGDIYLPSNWSKNPEWQPWRDDVNHMYLDEFRIFSDTGSGAVGSIMDGTIGEVSGPQPTNCVPGTPQLVQEAKDPQCVNGSRTVIQEWTRVGDVPATNGGQACSPIPYTVTTTEPCAVEPPPVNLTIITAVKTCRVTIQSQPPDQSGGWGVQFRWDLNNFGSRDTSAPFERARDFPAGTYQLGAIWTKTGQTPVYVPTQTYECK